MGDGFAFDLMIDLLLSSGVELCVAGLDVEMVESGALPREVGGFGTGLAHSVNVSAPVGLLARKR